MVVIAPSPEARVFIADDQGNNLLNCRSQFIDFAVNNDLLADSGIIKTTAQLTLAGVPVGGFPESLDPRINGLRWNKGNLVFVEIFINGNWVPHERGRLRILKPPKVPIQGENLVLSLGCELTFADRPASEESKPLSFWALWRKDNPLRSLRDVAKTTAINELAALANVPALVDSIPGNLNILPRNIDGSYVQAMGAIAYSGGYYLWIDSAGNMRMAKPNYSRVPDFGRTVANAAIEYTLLEGQEVPPNKVEVRAPRTLITNLSFRSKDFSESVTGESGAEELDSTGDDDDSTKTSRKTRRSLFPLAFPNDSVLIVASRTRHQRVYAADATGTQYLSRTIDTSSAPRALVFPAETSPTDPGGTSLVPSSRVVTTYTVTNGQTRTVKVERFEPGILVFPNDEESSESLVIAYHETKTWAKYLDGYEVTTATTDLKSGQSDISSEYDGQTVPPAPAKKEPAEKGDQGTEEGSAEFDQPADPNNAAAESERRLLALAAQISSPQELIHLAEEIGKAFYGRAYPSEWIVRYLYDPSYQPFKVWEWVEPSGLVVRYLADGDAWAITPDDAQFSAQGLYLGRVTGGNVVTPYRLVATTGGSGLSSGTRWETVATGSAGGDGTGSAIAASVWQTVATGQADGATDPAATSSNLWQTVATGSVGVPGASEGSAFSNTVFETVAFGSVVAPLFSQRFLSTIIGGRIGLISGDPKNGFPGNSTTVFYSPAEHDEISLVNGSGDWEKYNFTEASTTGGFSDSIPEDIYVRWDDAVGRLVIERVSWLTSIARTVIPIARDSGYAHPSNPRWRWVGAVVSTGGTISKTVGNCNVWNIHNQGLSSVQITPSGSSHVYTVADWRRVANSTVFTISWLQGGLTGVAVASFANILTTSSNGLGTGIADVGIGIDSTTDPAQNRNSSAFAGSRRPRDINYPYPVNVSTPLLVTPGFRRIHLLERGATNLLVFPAQSELYIEVVF